jgi:hypothetical protein
MAIVPDVSRLNSSNRRLDELAALPDDWDSYGAPPLSATSIKEARGVLLALTEQPPLLDGCEVNPTHIAPLPSGGVQLEWSGAQADIEVEVDPEGALAYLFIDRSGEQRAFTEAEKVPLMTIVDLVTRVLRP